jgi:hypothetical protein
VAGSGFFQAPSHGTKRFHGPYDGTHPVLQTCTSNNNVCDLGTLKAQHQKQDPMRFALSTRRVLPADQPREHEMDIQPWTYQVMAREMVREKKIESPSDPESSGVGDQRTYLYVALAHDTTPSESAANVGLAVEVKLQDDDATTYTSNHRVAFWSILRNGPAATTVELPAGTRSADIASISVRRLPLVGVPDESAILTVTDLDRAFFLRDNYLPRPSFASRHGVAIPLTAEEPSQMIWPIT